MDEKEMFEWIWRVYSNNVTVTGIKGKNYRNMRRNDSSFLGANESAHFGSNNVGNHSTMLTIKDHQRSFQKDS